MTYKQTTQVPNELFDIHLPDLTFSELKILLFIIRQTYGWRLKNGNRKQRDRITHGQFSTKTGLSRRIISETIQSLIIKHHIQVSDYDGNLLHQPKLRKGKVGIYYTPLFQTYAEKNKKVCKKKHIPMQNRVYNKTNNTKLKEQKEFKKDERTTKRISDSERIQQILHSRAK